MKQQTKIFKATANEKAEIEKVTGKNSSSYIFQFENDSTITVKMVNTATGPEIQIVGSAPIKINPCYSNMISVS